MGLSGSEQKLSNWRGYGAPAYDKLEFIRRLDSRQSAPAVLLGLRGLSRYCFGAISPVVMPDPDPGASG
jgi:hypothetical protein